jgi:hypothetical protein
VVPFCTTVFGGVFSFIVLLGGKTTIDEFYTMYVST